MLLRLAYLGLTDTFALVRLLPMGNRDKDLEILALRHQIVHRLRLLVRPNTILRWHRDLLRRCHAIMSRPKRPGRPRTVPSA